MTAMLSIYLNTFHRIWEKKGIDKSLDRVPGLIPLASLDLHDGQVRLLVAQVIHAFDTHLQRWKQYFITVLSLSKGSKILFCGTPISIPANN